MAAGSLPTLLEDHPVIAGVNDEEGLRAVLRSECAVVFLLFGDVLTLPGLVARLKAGGRTVFVNVDLVDGFSGREVVVRWVREHTEADGILSSRAPLVRAARELGLFAVHRFFLIDSISYRNLAKQVRGSKPDCVEVMPGCVPRVISWVVADLDVPVIAGGLVCDREDVFAALKAGASAIASSNREVWEM
ncbi:glycerol-3-phosphate responsive antiterminator (plasmid) [Streptomyces sp. BI20]|uniref:glycerol-3-phosphate responsive antiterminator n=1 Tax=Streptomyces sp. BI20 TaxID=3403460 RepID=UPI003C778844